MALAWQAYTISNAPTALALLGIAMTVPLIALLLFGGVISDRHSRRRVMLLADAMRAILLALLAALALGGTLALWQMMVIVALYGSAQAFFDPASDAILPELLPAWQLGQANALEQVVRPLALRLAGPALGGVLVGVLGPGSAFLADGATFVVSAATLWSMSARAAVAPASAPRGGPGSPRAASCVRASPTCAATSGCGEPSPAPASPTCCSWDRPRCCCRSWSSMSWAETECSSAWCWAPGGLGSVACALAMARSGLPSRSITFIYAVWALATLAVAGYGLATAIWQLMLASLAFNLLETAGTIVWATIKQRHVPGHMLGRVSSLDWLISIGLLPVSFALTAPLSAALGVRATLIGAGVAGAAATLGGLLLPGMRAVDRTLARPAGGAIAPPSSVAGAT